MLRLPRACFSSVLLILVGERGEGECGPRCWASAELRADVREVLLAILTTIH